MSTVFSILVSFVSVLTFANLLKRAAEAGGNVINWVIASVRSPVGLWANVLKLEFAFWSSPSCFLEPEVTIFGREGGTELTLS